MSTATTDINGILNQVTESQAARQRKADDDFRKLAHEIANGKYPIADHVEKVLIAAGKSVDDLRMLAERHLQRQADAAAVNRAADLAERRRGVEEQIQNNDAERDAAIDKWDAANVKLANKLSQIAADEIAAEQARNRLIASAPEQLASEYRMTTDRKRELQNNIHRMRADISRRAPGGVIDERKGQLLAQTGGRRNAASEMATEDELTRWRHEIEEWTAMAEKAETDLPIAEKQLIELQSREASMLERMLEA